MSRSDRICLLDVNLKGWKAKCNNNSHRKRFVFMFLHSELFNESKTDEMANLTWIELMREKKLIEKGECLWIIVVRTKWLVPPWFGFPCNRISSKLFPVASVMIRPKSGDWRSKNLDDFYWSIVAKNTSKYNETDRFSVKNHQITATLLRR